MADPFDILDTDPFEALDKDFDDPFASLGGDPFAALGGEQTTSVTPMPFEQSESFLKEIGGNALDNIKDIIHGGSKLVAAGVNTAIDATVRLPFNQFTRDEEDVQEITGSLKAIPGLVKEAATSEWDRIRSLYGPILSDFNFKPLKDEFVERPIDVLLDVGGIAELGALPVRLGATAAKGAASAGVRRTLASKGIDATRAVDQLLKTGDAGSAARGAVAASVQKNIALKRTLAERAQEAKRLEVILGPNADLMRAATVLDKTGSLLEKGNPFRLAYETIGAFPPIKRRIEIWRDFDGHKEILSRKRREIDREKEVVLRDIDQALEDTYAKLPADEQAAVMSHMTELNPERPLTPEGEAALSVLKQVPRKFRPDLARMGFDRGKQMRVVQAMAISRETHVRPGVGGKISLDEARRIVDRPVKEVNEKIAKAKTKLDVELNKGVKADRNKIAQLAKERDTLIEQKQLKLQAEDAWHAGQIEFVPGETTAESVASLDARLDEAFFQGKRHAEEQLIRPTSTHLSKKRTVDADPMTVEARFLEYADAITSLIGRQAIRSEAQNAVVQIPQHALNDVLRKLSPAYLNKKGQKFRVVNVDGEKVGLPEGVAKLYDEILRKRTSIPVGLETGTRFLDMTRGEFAKIVLGLNPGWFVYNVLGNSMLYALGAGSPTEFARAAGMRTSVSLQKWLTKHEWSVPKMVEKLAQDYRELVPRTEAIGFARYELGRTRYPELHGRAENVWGKWSIGKIAEKYRATTQKAVDKIGIGDLNEFAEEIYRSAMWLTQAKRQARAKHFVKTGELIRALDSESMRGNLQRMAQELDPAANLRGKGLGVSPETQRAVDLTNRFLNDYYKLGPVERQVFRRLFPFYSWMKFSNRLAAELPFKHPLRMSIAAHTSNAMNDAFTFDDDQFTPDWIKHMVPVKKNPDGTQEFKSGSGGNPFSGIIFGDEGIRGLAAGLNPVLLVPIQWTAGFSMFRGGPLRVSSSRRADGLVQPFGSGRTFKVSPTGVEETTPRPGPIMALARGGLIPIPFFREAEKAIRGGVHDDVGSMPELAMELGRHVAGHPRLRFMPQDEIAKLFGGKGPSGRGVFQTKEGESVGSNEEAVNRFLTAFGLRTSTVDVEKLTENQKARKEAARKSVLRALMEGN